MEEKDGIRSTCIVGHEPSHVFSIEHLFERIWRLNSTGAIAAVTVQIKKLAGKLKWIPPIRNPLKRFGRRLLIKG